MDSKDTIDDWYRSLPAELNLDAIAYAVVVSSGRSLFGLSGSALDEFVKQSLKIIMENGGRPVVSNVAGRTWSYVERYVGLTPAETADSLVADWHSLGRDPDYGEIWFATAEIAKEAYLPRE